MTKHNVCRSIRFAPYRAGMGPTFSLTMWDHMGQDSDGKFRIVYRLTMRDVAGKRGRILFAGGDFSTPHATDSKSTVRALMGFLCLKPGDTDADYFASYTPAQLDFCAAHADALNMEVTDRFGESA